MYLYGNFHRWAFTVIVSILLCTTAIGAQNPPSQIELNGFLLGQYKKVLDSTFGAPYEESRTEDGWLYRLYLLSEQSKAYMVVKFASHDEERIFSIQIAGNAKTHMTAFLGLRLGDDKSRAVEVLGRPSEVRPDAELKLELYIYKGRNYSVEIDADGKISSIQIFGYEGFLEERKSMPRIEDLERCVLRKDTDCLISVLAPDFEAYKDKETYTFSTAARKELSNPHSPLLGLLLGESGSLRAVFTEERESGEPELRLYKNGSSGVVFKFPNSKIIREIAYTFFAGKWRVWEIRFR